MFTNRLFCFLEWACSMQFTLQYLIILIFGSRGGHAQSTAPNNTSHVYLAKHMSWHIICMLQTRSPKSVTKDSWFLALAFIWYFNQNWNLSTHVKYFISRYNTHQHVLNFPLQHIARLSSAKGNPGRLCVLLKIVVTASEWLGSIQFEPDSIDRGTL